MIVKIGIASFLLAGTAIAAWERRVSRGEGEFTDAPPPHELPYFRASSCVGFYPKDRQLANCGSRTTLSRIGVIGRFVIFDLDYHFDSGGGSADAVGAKSVLVQTAPGEFREIYHRGPLPPDPNASFPASRILMSGRENVLVIRIDVGGMCRVFTEDFFAFDERGSHILDPKPISDAAAKEIPQDWFIYGPASAFHFERGLWESGTEPKNSKVGPKVGCCPGSVSVQFKVENGKFVVTGTSHEPN